MWKMSEFENMKNILEATGLYRVDDDSIIAAELKAYAAALDLCFSEKVLPQAQKATDCITGKRSCIIWF